MEGNFLTPEKLNGRILYADILIYKVSNLAIAIQITGGRNKKNSSNSTNRAKEISIIHSTSHQESSIKRSRQPNITNVRLEIIVPCSHPSIAYSLIYIEEIE